VLEALFASRSNYAIVDGAPRREPGYADLGHVARPAFAPEVH
jgi:UDP-3-O-[3-hydroxymyristoyl] N-acetylglucosamine deacetylase